jgi:hypothetical protein
LTPVTITADGPTVFCEGGDVTLTATAGSSYSWSNGASTQSITVNNSGAFTVTVTDANSCSNVSTLVNVTANAKPTVTLTASPYTRLLPGLTTMITASTSPAGNYVYTWERNGSIVVGATGASLPADLDGIGDYTVTATNGSGCTNSANISIGDSLSARLFVYPNPNNGLFQVSYHATGKHTVTVFDSKGAYVFRNEHVLNNFYQRMEIDIRKNGKGVYHIILSDSNGKKIAAGSVVVQ